MASIDDIYDMLSCNNDIYTQIKGIEEAKKIKSLWVLIMPIRPTSSKDIWENCAKVLVSKTDDELSPYYYHLLTWLQDVNWPGAELIYDRLMLIPDELIKLDFSMCIDTAVKNNDIPWQYTLDALRKDRLNIKAMDKK